MFLFQTIAASCTLCAKPVTEAVLRVSHLSTVTSGPLLLSIHCHLSRDIGITYDQKARLLERDYSRLKPSTICTKIMKWRWKILPFSFEPGWFPSTLMEDARCFLMIPLPLTELPFPTPWPVTVAGPCVLSSVCCDCRGHFLEHQRATKPLLSSALSPLRFCPWPQAEESS